MKHLWIAAIVASTLSLAACNESAVPPPAETPAAQNASEQQPAPQPVQREAPATAVAQTAQLKPLTDAERLAPLAAAAGSCNVEAIDFVGFEPKVFELERKQAVVSGWLLPAAGAEDAATARLRLTQSDGLKAWEIPVTTRISREDVVASHGGKAADMPGFNQAVDFAALEPGTYRMTLIYAVGGTSQVCDNGREIDLN